MRRLLQAFQDHGQDDEACSVSNRARLRLRITQPAHSNIHYGDGMGQLDAENAAKCAEPDISNPFRTLEVRNRRGVLICEG
jgi:hypothetical protein